MARRRLAPASSGPHYRVSTRRNTLRTVAGRIPQHFIDELIAREQAERLAAA